jgi:hypothetical protein
MPLSNTALFDELLAEAKGAKNELSVVYRAIAETEGKTTGMFRDKAKDLEDVKARIRQIIKQTGASAG